MKAIADTRKLSRAHFAFMSAVVQGVDPMRSWTQFLSFEGDRPDARVVRSTIAWMRGAFAAAARRESKPGPARLVVIDIARPGAVGHPLYGEPDHGPRARACWPLSAIAHE